MHRKVVTALFCDVVGSTALGESIDPEALRALLARYFERMRGIVERHGGTVEKFIGDAVVAIGQATLALVRGAVEVEAVEPLELKGKAAAYAEALGLYEQKENLVAATRVEHALEELRAGARA